MRLVSDRQAQDSPTALWVRHPCGATLLAVLAAGADDGAGVAAGAAGAGAGCADGAGVAGAVAAGGEVVGGLVCARVIGAAIRNAAAASANVRCMGPS